MALGSLSAKASPLTHYYTYQPVEGVPQPQTSFALGTDWTLNLSQSPDALYAQNAGGNYGNFYRTNPGDGTNLIFKFNRQPGDTNVYDVKVNLSGYNQWSGNGSPSMTLLWGTDAFGFNDNDTANHGRVWWSADTADLTQVASSAADGSFTWNSGNVTNFRIGADQQSAYLVVLGSANSYGYVYSASADFTAVMVPEPASVATQPLNVGSFDDGLADGAQMYSSTGVVVPLNVQGAADAVGILADGSSNQIVYRFKRPSGYTRPLSVNVSALVYGEVPNLSLSYSYDGVTWISCAQLIAAGQWTNLTGGIDVPADRASLYVRVGGQAAPGGAGYVGYVDTVHVTLHPSRHAILRAEAGCSFSDEIRNDDHMNDYAGAVIPWTVLGIPHTCGLFSDGGTNFIQYRFDRPGGYSVPLTASIDATVYGEQIAAGENFSLDYSYDGTNWFQLRQLQAADQQNWNHLAASVDLDANRNSLYIRIGGVTAAGGPGWIGYVDKVRVSFVAQTTGGIAQDVGTDMSDEFTDAAKLHASAGVVVPYFALGEACGGIFSDGGFNYLEYKFDLAGGTNAPLAARVQVPVYGEWYDTATENFSLYYSFDHVNWFEIDRLTEGEKFTAWSELSAYVTLWPGEKTLYVRVGGQTQTGGPGWIGYVKSVNVTWQSTPTADVTGFGASGNGISNDGPAIQSAIDSLPEKGGTVYFPSGTYLVTGSSLVLKSNVALVGAGDTSVIVKGKNLGQAIQSDRKTNIGLLGLRFAVETGTPATTVNGLVYFLKCRNVRVSNCTFDSSTDGGLPSLFSHLLINLCRDVVCINNVFVNSAGNCTGMNGEYGNTEEGGDAIYAYNQVLEYCDTGIGLWTGAWNCRVYNNTFRARAELFTSYPVGVDMDGGRDSIVAGNIIQDGQIGLRFYDVHDGAYPVVNMVAEDNVIYNQRRYGEFHPPYGVKLQTDSGLTSVRFTNNEINEPSDGLGYVGGSFEGTTTSLTMDGNSFSGAGAMWSWFWISGALSINSGGSIIDPATSIGTNRLLNQVLVFPSNFIAASAATFGSAYSSTISESALNPAAIPLTYEKLSGPAWLNIATDGALSGTPQSSDGGVNVWNVRVKDGFGGTDITRLAIQVLAYPTNNYGTLQGSSTTSGYIKRIQLAGLDKTSGNNNGYADFRSLIATLTPGQSVSYTFTPGGNSSTVRWTVWIDFNRDGDFGDSGEMIVGPTAGASSAVSGSFTVPSVASVGPSRMRIAMSRSSTGQTSPTGSFSYGEVEDYSVQIGTSPTPNAAPYFLSDLIAKAGVTAGSPMSASLAADAADWEGDALTYVKTSGPAWLTVASNGAASGTPPTSAQGTNSFGVSVTDASGGTDTATLQINVVAAPFELWKQENFTPQQLAQSGVVGDLDDPDRDGIANLLEYALGLDPNQSSASGTPFCSTSGAYLTLTFNRQKIATDITYGVKATGDLGSSWTQIWSSSSVPYGGGSNPSQQVTVQDTVPVSESPKRFMRLKVTKP